MRLVQGISWIQASNTEMSRGAVEMVRTKRRRGKRKRTPLFWHKSTIAVLLTLVVCGCFFRVAGNSVGVPLLPIGPLAGQIVLIDPGHGGIDPGACGSLFFEKDIVLDVSLLLGQKLERYGAKVVYTRTSDGVKEEEEESGSSAYRSALIEDSKATIVVSIHCNDYKDPRIKGAQVFWNSAGNELSGYLADLIQMELQAKTGTSREVSDDIVHFMLDNAQVPAVTVELGFLSNPEEEMLLGSSVYQDTLAQCICDAILTFCSGDH